MICYHGTSKYYFNSFFVVGFQIKKIHLSIRKHLLCSQSKKTIATQKEHFLRPNCSRGDNSGCAQKKFILDLFASRL